MQTIDSKTIMIDDVAEARRLLKPTGQKFHNSALVALASNAGVAAVVPISMAAFRSLIVGRKGDEPFTAHVNLTFHADGSISREWVVSGFQQDAVVTS